MVRTGGSATIDDVEAGGRWGVMPLRAPDEVPTAASLGRLADRARPPVGLG
jgi:hypothetical protein